MIMAGCVNWTRTKSGAPNWRMSYNRVKGRCKDSRADRTMNVPPRVFTKQGSVLLPQN